MYALLVILILLPGYGKLFASNEVKSGYGCLYDTLTKDSTRGRGAAKIERGHG